MSAFFTALMAVLDHWRAEQAFRRIIRRERERQRWQGKPVIDGEFTRVDRRD